MFKCGRNTQSKLVAGKIQRNKYIFEKKVVAFTKILNHILQLIHSIPTNPEGTNFIQISENSYLEFKYETDKNILYLNKKNTILLEEITKLFARNVFLHQLIGSAPNEDNYLLFDENELEKIKKLKDELKTNFQKELKIKTFII